MEKRYRFEFKLNDLTSEQIRQIIKTLGKNELKIISKFKYRIHRKYTYAYIPASSENLRAIYKTTMDVFSKIGEVFNTDFSNAVKTGTRETVVYNQGVVKN